jgi:hypothetical protein
MRKFGLMAMGVLVCSFTAACSGAGGEDIGQPEAAEQLEEGLKPEPTFACAGFLGIACPGKYVCVDDWRDDCNPASGGADCPGLCRDKPRQSCSPSNPACEGNEVCVPNAVCGLHCTGTCVLAECDPELICTQVLTCVDGELYPTGCGPANCDSPIGECADTCDPGLVCTQVLTCVDGLLYPTGCGPSNCDEPIGKC